MVLKSATGRGDFLRLRAFGAAGGPLSFSSSKAAHVARRTSRGLISSGRRAVRFLLAIVDSLSELARHHPNGTFVHRRFRLWQQISRRILLNS